MVAGGRAVRDPWPLVFLMNFCIGLCAAASICLFVLALQNSKIFVALLMFVFTVGALAVFGWLVKRFLAFVAMVAKGGAK
jgi:hypothetical protein